MNAWVDLLQVSSVRALEPVNTPLALSDTLGHALVTFQTPTELVGYIDAAFCYRRSNVVCLCVCLCDC